MEGPAVPPIKRRINTHALTSAIVFGIAIVLRILFSLFYSDENVPTMLAFLLVWGPFVLISLSAAIVVGVIALLKIFPEGETGRGVALTSIILSTGVLIHFLNVSYSIPR